MFEYQIVNGYLRKDGTWVDPHLRGVPNGIDFDNLSYDFNEDCQKNSLLENKELTDIKNDLDIGFDSDVSNAGDSFDFDFMS